MVTLKNIAEKVGVQESTVSRILNRKNSTSMKFAEATIRKVEEAAKNLGYQPNSAARALATRRTGYIGFILSDSVQGGWSNQYFASYLAGAERAARRRGYGLNISLYNLSNLESFVFPKSIGQQSVDGIILCGPTEMSVVNKFSEAHIPAVQIGTNISTEGAVPIISFDTIGGYWKMARRCAGLGHRHMLLCIADNAVSRNKAEQFAARLKEESETSHMELDIFVPPHGLIDLNAARPLMNYWLSHRREDRPTVILGSDQMMAGMTRELFARGIKCPDEVTLVSGTDTLICMLTNPSLTSISYDLKAIAEKAVDSLIDFLDNKVEIPMLQILEGVCDGVVIERESSGPVPRFASL